MPEISDERLARYKAIEVAGETVLREYPVVHIQKFREAFKTARTPLVCDEELEAFIGTRIGRGMPGTTKQILSFFRQIGALHWRKAADELVENWCEEDDSTAVVLLRQWAGEQGGENA